MGESSGVGMCKCVGGANVKLISKFCFEFGELQVFYCNVCDGVTIEASGFSPEHFPNQKVFDLFSDVPGNRAVLILSSTWLVTVANILTRYANMHEQAFT